uniref:Small ribosomal subunit protein uS3c n=1 Tax=Selaginella sanguinolenta TaxID=493175 RepID=A0A482CKN5_9TRAC|nr:ribosomal protein S3 [Selaginella sanguinolenta]QBL76337.1 ribosomal protein S3 [Selaginella sanguinolenta]
MNPPGFRPGITKNHHPNRSAQPKIHSKYLREDKQVRDCIDAYVHGRIWNSDSKGSGAEGIERVGIRRKTDSLPVETHTVSPAVPIKSHGRGIEQLRKNVQQNLSDRIGRVHITLTEIAKPYGEPNIPAKYIALQLKNRVAFRRTMKKAIEPARKNGRKGIKIQIAGRPNGAEIARVERAREGRVPLQTLRAQIDHRYYPARTIYGVLGTKVWILKGGSKC